MNPHATPPTSLTSIASSSWRNRQLVAQMVRREIVGRYRGSAMGLLWSLLNPVFMLVVYTFVFSVVFKARWSGAAAGGEESRGQFAVVLLAGMLVHGLFAEVVNRAPSLILSNVNYVKRVIFPLEVLPIVSMGAALFHAVVGILVLMGGFFAFNGFVPWTAVFVPAVLLPLIFLTLGVAWLLASVGVFMRDVGQIVGVMTTVLMFLSPVFFPVSAVPESLRPWMLLNPLTFIIEQVRAVLIWGQLPDWRGWLTYTGGAIVVAWLGYAWFQKTRKGFADVL